jgi:hypothetical protein
MDERHTILSIFFGLKDRERNGREEDTCGWWWWWWWLLYDPKLTRSAVAVYGGRGN